MQAISFINESLVVTGKILRYDHVPLLGATSAPFPISIALKITRNFAGQSILFVERFERVILRAFYFIRTGFNERTLAEVTAFEASLESWRASDEPGNEYRAILRIRQCFYLGSTKLDLRGLGLTRLPPQIGMLSRLKEVDLSVNKLVTIPSQIGNLKQLIRLNLSVNKLSTIPAESKQLFSLKSLDLSYNEFTELPQMICGLTGLEELDLQRNAIDIIPDEISSLTSLKSFYINNNTLKSLPSTLGALNSLVELSVSHNSIVNLPESIWKLTKLVVLDVSHCSLGEVSPSIGKLKDLKTLNLSANALAVLPQEFGQLVNLELLMLNQNNLKTLSHIGLLPKLKLLDFHGNKDLHSIPEWLPGVAEVHYNRRWSQSRIKFLRDEYSLKINPRSRLSKIVHALFFKISRLIDLIYWFTRKGWSYSAFRKWCKFEEELNQWAENSDIRGNKAYAVQQIRQAIRDDILDLAGSDLTALPSVLSDLKHLIYLHLQENNLTDLPENLRNLINVQSLYINNNNFTSLPDVLFGFRNLVVFAAFDNPLTSVPPAIGNLDKLQFLFLDRCRFSILPNTLGNLRELYVLTLEGCQLLSNLPLSLGNLPYLRFIYTDEGHLEDQVESILERCRSVGSEERLSRYAGVIQAWVDYAKNKAPREFNLNPLDALADDEKLKIDQWLSHMSTAADFSENQSELAYKVCAILETLGTNDEFKEDFFAQVTFNLAQCGDRAAMSFNEIYSYWYIYTLPEGASFIEKIHALARFARTMALRAALSTLIDEEQKKNKKIEFQNVHIYLHYESTLKTKLDLLSPIEGELYGEIGNRAWIRQDLLERSVNENYIAHMADHSLMQKLAEQSSEFKTIWKPIDENFSSQMELLDDQLLDEKKPISSVDYDKQSKGLKLERERAFKATLIDWLNKLMTRSQNF